MKYCFADKPRFTEELGKVTVVAGMAKLLEVTAKGNPNKIDYKWTRNGVTVSTGPVYNLTSATKDLKGKYECVATNDVGSNVMSFELDVQCKCSLKPFYGCAI